MSLTYLGTGGFLVRKDDDRILTAPFFSNPGLFRVGLGMRLRPDRGRILDGLNRFMPGIDRVDGILAGHSHYDHLMDLPWITEHRIRQGVIYGNETMTHLLSSAIPEGRLQAVNKQAGNSRLPGEWIAVGKNWRIMALESSHASHFLGIKLYGGRVHENLPVLPRCACGWKEGQTYTYLIDYLGEVDSAGLRPVLFRVHYQDAASPPTDGFVPEEVLAERRVDVAIVTVAAFGQTSSYPEAILRDLGPRHAILGHWEDFFRNPARPPKVVRGTNLLKFIRRLEPVLPCDADWTLPKPGVTLTFNICEGEAP